MQLFGPLGEKGACSGPIVRIGGIAAASTFGGSKTGTVMFQVGIDLNNVLQAELAHDENNNRTASHKLGESLEK